MKDYIVRKQIAIRAGSDQVWRALTDPNITERYFFGCRVHSDWIVGSPITFTRKILWIFPFELQGTIVKVFRGKLLQYTLKNKRSSTESHVTIELYEENGKTIVSVNDDVGGEDENAAERFKRSLKGWDKILNGLKRVTEIDLKQ